LQRQARLNLKAMENGLQQQLRAAQEEVRGSRNDPMALQRAKHGLRAIRDMQGQRQMRYEQELEKLRNQQKTQNP